MRNKLIKTTKQFDEKTIEERVLYWHKLASSNNEALEIVQNERDKAVKETKILSNALENAQTQVNQQKETINTLIKIHSEKEQSLSKRVIELQTELKRYEDIKKILG